ncbi:unnamed protein product [Trichogramma brassicae]|uniref:Dolichyl-diphosphooligosaccharide--protein glycosyltransferase subunit DAD1 n=2 Tax=Trichogramma TaxID=7490 RepID=A0A6H5J058_9HYME|nr:dolichyl-diphosphooligosaccharide--protein glycosyltransferase subunit DAD1 [Trichogramma pretiosum]CAB0040684.1 unnamed protein product [Trichogramma brassicae]
MSNHVISKIWQDYKKITERKTMIIDAYLLYVLITGIIQFIYCCSVGTYPFNSFLSGFISTISCFVLGMCLRLQACNSNGKQFNRYGIEKGFADFIFAQIVLHIVIVNFIG